MKRILILLLTALAVALLSLSCDSRANDEPEEESAYSIGDVGPAGGTVFYVNPNYVKGSTDEATNWHYLEAAPHDLDKIYIFGYYRDGEKGANRQVLTKRKAGTGKSNTFALIKTMGDRAYSKPSGSDMEEYAALACTAYKCGGFTDWFLPSRDELDLMYINLKKAGKGNMTDNTYWSSTEHFESNAWSQYFYNGQKDGTWKKRSDKLYVRPIRSFI